MSKPNLPPRGVHLSESTIPKALAVLGLDYVFLNQSLGLKLTAESELSPHKLPLKQFVFICRLLFVSTTIPDLEYDYERHRKMIWMALCDGMFDLPMNQSSMRVLWHVGLDRREQAEFYRKEFGFWRSLEYRWLRFKSYKQIVWRVFSKYRARQNRIQDLKNQMMGKKSM